MLKDLTNSENRTRRKYKHKYYGENHGYVDVLCKANSLAHNLLIRAEFWLPLFL